MAIDQRDVSSKLRFMDDRALQQYAAMHKSDPYIFPLAFQESQNRQKLRMSQQAQMGQQPQPKVADQALAQMAPQQMPEDLGIATLPAPNMKFGAEGGIMGYEGYGEEPQQFSQEPVLRMAGGGIAGYSGGGAATAELANLRAARERYIQAGADTSGIDQAIAFLEAKPGRAAAQRAASDSAPPAQMPGFAEQMAQDITPPMPVTAQATMPAPGYTRPGMVNDPRLATPRPTSAPAEERGAAPKVDTTRRNTGDPSAARKEPAPATTDVTGMFETALEKADKKTNPYEEQIKAVNSAKVKAGEENVSGLEAIQKQFSDIYKGRKERLDTREGEIGKMKDQSLGLALLNAGAAMMSTRGSIGQAIGAGIDTGSKQYVAGLDKINSAKDKLSDARDRLEEIEAQRGELSARELHKARNEVKSLTTAGMENLIQAAMAERKINRAEAVDFVKTQLTVATADKDRTSREKIAAIGEGGANARSAAQIAATLNTPDRLVFNQLLKDNGNDAVKAAEAMQKMKAEKFNMYEAYSKYLAGFAGKENLMKGPDDFDVFAKRFIPTVTPSKNTTVRTQPGG